MYLGGVEEGFKYIVYVYNEAQLTMKSNSIFCLLFQATEWGDSSGHDYRSHKE